MNKTESTCPLSEQMLKDTSGAVVDMRGRYIGLIVGREEYSHHMPDGITFERALEQLKEARVPVNEERVLRNYFWLTVWTAIIAIILWQLILRSEGNSDWVIQTSSTRSAEVDSDC